MIKFYKAVKLSGLGGCVSHLACDSLERIWSSSAVLTSPRLGDPFTVQQIQQQSGKKLVLCKQGPFILSALALDRAQFGIVTLHS